MPGVLNRQTLERMKRVDLQRLCKDHGLKANLKSESLIDLLLDTNDRASKPQPAALPQRASSIRIFSRVPRPISRLQSTSSVIIHSESEDDDAGRLGESDAQPTHLPPPNTLVGPSTRTRKAKEAQFRLGVGRPVVAGGSGARAVTKSISVSKSKRAKSSRSLKPTEETIPEESENTAHHPTPPIAGPSNLGQCPSTPKIEDRTSLLPDRHETRMMVYSIMQEIVKPLEGTVASLQQQALAHAVEVATLKARIDTLTAELQGYRQQNGTIQQMSESIDRLQIDLRMVRGRSADPTSREPLTLSTPISISSASPPHVPDLGLFIGDSRSSKVKQAEPSVPARPQNSTTLPFEYPPAPARSPSHRLSKAAGQSALGKRRREADLSPIVELGREEIREEELRTTASGPGRKRPKLVQDSREDHSDTRPNRILDAGPSTQVFNDRPEPTIPDELSEQSIVIPPPRQFPKFTVFEGPEELPPTSLRRTELTGQTMDDVFTDRDFDFFDYAHVNGRGNIPKTSTANASENQRPFNYSFPLPGHPPMTSTPAPTGNFPGFSGPESPMFNHFPLPEVPHSPSPIPSSSYGHRVERGGRIERNDPFHPFGTPPSTRNPSGSSTVESNINPSAFLRTPPPTLPDLLDNTVRTDGRRKASSNDVGAGLGMSLLPQTDDIAPIRRTMYGTELEGDTRFGDFGVEGVATGFWTGGRF